jgi:hypothetical protein
VRRCLCLGIVAALCVKALLQPDELLRITNTRQCCSPTILILRRCCSLNTLIARRCCSLKFPVIRHCCSLIATSQDYLNMRIEGIVAASRLSTCYRSYFFFLLQCTARPSLCGGSVAFSLSRSLSLSPSQPLTTGAAALISSILALTICKMLMMTFGSEMDPRQVRIISPAWYWLRG